MEDKVSSTLSGLEGELKGQFYPLTGMTKEVQQKLIDDHFLFKEGDRFLQVSRNLEIHHSKLTVSLSRNLITKVYKRFAKYTFLLSSLKLYDVGYNFLFNWLNVFYVLVGKYYASENNTVASIETKYLFHVFLCSFHELLKVNALWEFGVCLLSFTYYLW